MSKKFNQSHANKIIATIEQVESDRDEWKLQHENLLSVRQSDLQAIAKLESELSAVRLERGNKVALLLLDIADGQLKQQALQSQLSATQAREAMLVEVVTALQFINAEIAKCNIPYLGLLTKQHAAYTAQVLSNSTEHTDKFTAEMKAKTLEDAAEVVSLHSEESSCQRAADKLRRMANELRGSGK